MYFSCDLAYSFFNLFIILYVIILVEPDTGKLLNKIYLHNYKKENPHYKLKNFLTALFTY